MWRHPITAKQIRVLAEDWGVREQVTADGEVETKDADQPEGWFQVIKVRPPFVFFSHFPKDFDRY